MAGTPNSSTYAPAPSNTMGLVGFLMTLLTCGALSPIGLIVSLIALRKSPRLMAVLGTIVGLLGIGGYAIVIMTTIAVGGAAKEGYTHIKIAEAIKTINEHRALNNDQIPENIEGIKLVQNIKDYWNEPLRYDRTGNAFKIRSSGADKKMDTADDIVSQDFESDAELELNVGTGDGAMDGPITIPEDGGAPVVTPPEEKDMPKESDE